MGTDKKFYKTEDIQRIFGVGRSKAIALMKTEGFPAIKLGRMYRVDAERLEDWIKQNEGKNISVNWKNKETKQ